MAVDKETYVYQNPFLKGCHFSKLFFWWLKDILWYSKSHDLVSKDLYDTIDEDRSEPLRRKFELVWTQEVEVAKGKKKKPSLWKAVVKTYFKDFSKYAVLLALFIVIQLVQPLLLQEIMSYFRTESTMSPRCAYTYATIFIFLEIFRTAFLVQGSFHLSRLGMRARIACSSLIYKKVLQLPSSGNRQTSSSLISLLSVDVAKFDTLFYHGPTIILVPLQLLAVTYLMYRMVGLLPAVAGVVLMVLQTFPFQAVYSKLVLKIRVKQASSTDSRIHLIGEIVNGMRAVKMYVWEQYLEKLVYASRNLEISYYRKMSHLSSVVYTFFTTSHRVSSFAVLLTYQLCSGQFVSVDKILPVTQYLANLQNNCVYFFFALRNIIDACVSIERIEDFLLLEEVKPNWEIVENNNGAVVSIDHVTASWDGNNDVLKSIGLNFASGKLYIVIGSVGSGKSSLLKLILGELNSTSGKMSVRGRISYASQEPWLFNGSVRDNILFGEKYQEERYEKVVNACALTEDFNQLSHGDKTLVGERGSSLSGGQRSRVNLARAVYRDADIYLLDDPLSAVDARVAKTITKDCVNWLLKDKTRILVTHNCNRQFDETAEVLVLEHGRIEFKGSLETFFEKDNRYTEDEKDVLEESTKAFSIDTKKPISFDNEEPKEIEELTAKGAMKSSVYLNYIKAGGWTLAFSTILANCLFVASASTFDLGLAVWSTNLEQTVDNHNETNEIYNIEDNYRFRPEDQPLSILGILITMFVFTALIKTFLLFKLSFNVGRNVHNCIFSRLMIAPMRFFESNSTGKIMNRFSDDTGVVDNVLPHILVDAMNVIALILIALVTAVVANWWIIILCNIFLIISLSIGVVYVKAIQKVKRLVGIAKSPILSLATSSLVGLTTIRSCRAEKMMVQDFDSRQDHHTKAQFLSIALVEAFSMWIQLINLGLLASITYFCLFLKGYDTYEGYVGLSLVQIFIMTQLTSATGMRIADVLANMTSVERMLQFTELEQESLIEKESDLVMPQLWPDKGQIRFERFYMRYSEDSDPILWNVNCVIEAGSKVGIVGRTGAGKSSLISALFRFANTEGFIFIDEIDIKTIDLYKLRSKISIIPQESVLFSGSLRQNLDPLEQLDDVTLWSALENVEMKHIFDSLDYQIIRSGSNLSVGQRQLLCLARAIISKNKILILDEATANIDSATDALIQKTIRNKFKECTVLTIAHRLETVMDCDKVLVMDEGRLVEYDYPMVLLQNNNSYLFKMVEPMGKPMIQNLMEIADQAYRNRENADK